MANISTYCHSVGGLFDFLLLLPLRFFPFCSVNSLFFFSTFTINSRLISSAIFISSLSFMILFKVFCEYSSGWEREEIRSRIVKVHGCFALENKQTTFTIRCKSLKFNIQCNCQSQLKLKRRCRRSLQTHFSSSTDFCSKLQVVFIRLCGFISEKANTFSRQTLSTFQKL